MSVTYLAMCHQFKQYFSCCFPLKGALGKIVVVCMAENAFSSKVMEDDKAATSFF